MYIVTVCIYTYVYIYIYIYCIYIYIYICIRWDTDSLDRDRYAYAIHICARICGRAPIRSGPREARVGEEKDKGERRAPESLGPTRSAARSSTLDSMGPPVVHGENTAESR